jgi:hypothetical protein
MSVDVMLRFAQEDLGFRFFSQINPIKGKDLFCVLAVPSVFS